MLRPASLGPAIQTDDDHQSMTALHEQYVDRMATPFIDGMAALFQRTQPPLHETADILFCHGKLASGLVPVGKDQLPHIETTRLIWSPCTPSVVRSATKSRASRSPSPWPTSTPNYGHSGYAAG